MERHLESKILISWSSKQTEMVIFNKMHWSVWVVFMLLPPLSQGQEIIDLPLTNACLYNGESLPEELFRFPIETDTFETVLADILRKTISDVSVSLKWANVESVASVNENGKYHVLYSRRLLKPLMNQAADRVLAFAMLAHAAGHCANEHRLDSGPDEDEELAADEFMGYALALMGFSLEDVSSIPTKMPLRSGVPDNQRLEAIRSGYQRADASLLNAAHASYFEKNIQDAVNAFPKFPLPPPQWTADANLDAYCNNCKTLYDAERIIRKAMDATGYYSRRYYYVPEGFAIVSRLEQFNEDGSCKGESSRWNTKAVSTEKFSLSNYMYSLFVPQPGHFRVIVFVVTPQTFNADTSQKITRESATAWLNEGRNRLPEAIGNLPFQANKTAMSALVYEFIANESDKKLKFMEESPVEGMTHLRMSKLLDHLH
jgi:hypothetical protein